MKGLPEWAEREAPASQDLLSVEELEHRLKEEPLSSFIVGGDVLLGDRGAKVIGKEGMDYPFRSIRPLLRKSKIVLANLEGPIAAKAEPQDRNYSYRGDPQAAPALFEAGINVVTLANNHLLDCGREGVLETLEITRSAGIATVGAGSDRKEAHLPALLQSGPWRIGVLGYYWNRRTAATGRLPGSAMETDEDLARDIQALKPRVNRIVVTFHWGVPYERVPLEKDRIKAQYAIDCGADIVIGHHPHIVQEYEIYHHRPIFYSLGNFVFGSGNSKAEGLLLSVRFEPDALSCTLFPLYVKNRDPRVLFQPKVLTGRGGEKILSQLKSHSKEDGERLEVREGWGYLRVGTHSRSAPIK